MTYPTYVVLHLKRIDVSVGTPVRNGAQQVQSQILQPPARHLLPLPMMGLSEDQLDGHAMTQNGGTMLHFQERFEDVLDAILRASKESDAIAIPLNRGRIEEATAADAAPVTGVGLALVPNPPERAPARGDLKIVPLEAQDGVVWLVMHYRIDEDGNWEWSRVGIPQELRAAHTTEEAAEKAVAIAGYARRLFKD